MKQYPLFLLLFFTTCTAIANPLPANEAFPLEARALDSNTLLLRWQTKPGYFIYKDRIKINTTKGSTYPGNLIFPQWEEKDNPQGHTDAIYHGLLSLPIPMLAQHAGKDNLTLYYQGCSDAGFCYPPQVKNIQLTFTQDLDLINAVVTESPHAQKNNSNPGEQVLLTHHWLFAIVSFFGFGLLLSFTPCILPMVPVLSGIIIGQGKHISTRKAFLLSLSYVLSMSFTYATIGAIVAVMGNNLQVAMQSPLALISFSVIFILLALSMFDLYELKLPISLQNKLVHITRSQQGGHYLGAALMGSLSTLILSPCVTAPLIGALSYIAHSGNILLGSSALFCLGLGMGIPLLLIGTSASKILPNAGRWMNSIKTLFGFVMLAMAIYILQRILPPLLTMTLWGTLLIFAGIYSGALTSMTTKLQKFRQGVSIICLLYGILIFIGVSQGHDNPLQPLLAPNRTIEASIRTVKTVADADEAIAHAKGKPVMLDFYADWCTSCKTIAATVLQHPQIQSELKHFVVLKIDVTANSAESSALLRHFNVVAPPTFIFYDTQGNEVRLVGNTSSALFLKQLKNTLANRN